MNLRPTRLALGFVLAILAADAAAQPAAEGPPPLKEVEALWAAFLSRLSVGDLQGAAWYVHVRRQPYVLPAPPLSPRDRRKLQQLTDELAFCKIEPGPLVVELRPGEYYYPVNCRRGEETGSEDDDYDAKHALNP